MNSADAILTLRRRLCRLSAGPYRPAAPAHPPGAAPPGCGRPARRPRVLAALAGLAVALAAALLPLPVQALDCPPGWRVRGINCCRVAAGRVHCARNPFLPNSMAPLMANPRFIAPPARVDDSDITEAALAQPAFRPRPLTGDRRVLAAADDVCTADACRFDTMRALAAERRGGPGCIAALRAHACRHSMWRDLGLEQRFARILVLGRPFAEAHDVDVRALPCIAAIETGYLEPLTVSELNCTAETSDQGLPQIIRPTFRWLVGGLDFRSTVVDYGADPAARADALFPEIAQSVRHQLELMVAVLAHSGLNAERTNYLNAFINYNGSSRSINYGHRVQACFDCLRDRIDPDTFAQRGDPMRCLGVALGGDMRTAFDRYRALCAEAGAPLTPTAATPGP